MGKFKYEKYDYKKIGIGVFESFNSTWSVDLSRYFNYNVERELTAILSQKITEEIDKRIIEYLSKS